jgi:hypothetical protein
LTSIKDVNIYFFYCIFIFFVILYYQGKKKNNVVLQVSSATLKNTKQWMQPFYNANDNDNLKKKKKVQQCSTTRFEHNLPKHIVN